MAKAVHIPNLNWNIEVSPAIQRKLRSFAAKRDITTDKLAIMILEKVVNDNLINAVLDDR